MKILLILSMMIFMACCTMPPKDYTPVWSKNNRYAVEMNVDCNTIEHSIGLVGCAFKGIPDGTITFRKLLSGSLLFESSGCSDFNVPAYQNKDNIISMERMYDNGAGDSCSFKVMRSVDNIGKYPFDHVMMGRVFIGIVDDNPYYSFLEFGVGEPYIPSDEIPNRNSQIANVETFKGVGWHQRKHLEANRKIVVYPKGNIGTFRMRCGEELVKVMHYDSSPFEVLFDSPLRSCDYALVATNDDHPDIEFGWYIHEVQSLVLDVKTPQTSTDRKYRKFNFKEKNKDNKYVVYAVEVNDKRCIRKHECKDKKGKSVYVVRGYTMAGRMFYGEYYPAEDRWEVK